MMKLLRRHKDWLMIVIAILAIPFIFYFVRTPDYGAMGRGYVGQIYGRKLTQVEIDRNARLGGLAQALGMSEFWETLSAQQQGNAGYGTFAVNLIVLRHEAERLGLRPSPSEAADVVRKLPAFQSDAGFDINKFSDFVRNGLAPMGLGEEHIEQLVRDQLNVDEIKKLLSAGVTISKGELDENFQRGYDNFYVSIIRFRPADFDKGITLKDEDIQKYYDAHKGELKTEEKRKAEFVQLTLTEEQKKLKGKERIEVLQKLSDRATDFTQALLEKDADFKKAADKFQLPVHETAEFTAAAPDPQLKADPQISAAAFKLSLQEPNSDAVQVADGFYILHLTSVTASRPLTVEEAKPKVVEALKKSRARELMSTKGAEVVQQLREAKKSGQPLEAAIQKAGVKPEKLPPFAMFDEEKTKTEEKEKTGAEDKEKAIAENKEKTKAEDKEKAIAEDKEKTKAEDKVKAIAKDKEKTKTEDKEKAIAEDREKTKAEDKEKAIAEDKDKEKAIAEDKEPKKNEPDELQTIKNSVAFLSPGEISDFFPFGETGLVAILEKRESPGGADAGEKKAEFEKKLLDNKERITFYEWLRERQQAAGLQGSKS